ncbi:hypothetical protein ACPCSP_25670 [Streptomyces cinereoruber]|uniref:hypothetical protein n=1 Tax=Streptomyces cinereoruber TaxID=67260 RepID=UPI003C30929F
MSVISGLGTLGVSLALVLVLWFGTGKNAGSGKMPALGWGATFFLALLAGSGLAVSGDPLKFRGAVQDLLSFLNKIGSSLQAGGVTMAGLAVLILVIVLYKKMTTRILAVLGILLFFAAGSAGGTMGTLSGALTSIVNEFA